MSAPSFFEIATRPAIVKRAAIMGLIVGNVIAALNYGDKILMGQMNDTDWLKIAITFLVPYSVSTISSVLAMRDQEALLSCMSEAQGDCAKSG